MIVTQREVKIQVAAKRMTGQGLRPGMDLRPERLSLRRSKEFSQKHICSETLEVSTIFLFFSWRWVGVFNHFAS